MTYDKAKGMMNRDRSRVTMYRSSDLTQELAMTPNGTTYINYLALNTANKPKAIDTSATDWQIAVKVD